MEECKSEPPVRAEPKGNYSDVVWRCSEKVSSERENDVQSFLNTNKKANHIKPACINELLLPLCANVVALDAFAFEAVGQRQSRSPVHPLHPPILIPQRQ